MSAGSRKASRGPGGAREALNTLRGQNSALSCPRRAHTPLFNPEMVILHGWLEGRMSCVAQLAALPFQRSGGAGAPHGALRSQASSKHRPALIRPRREGKVPAWLFSLNAAVGVGRGGARGARRCGRREKTTRDTEEVGKAWSLRGCRLMWKGFERCVGRHPLSRRSGRSPPATARCSMHAQAPPQQGTRRMVFWPASTSKAAPQTVLYCTQVEGGAALRVAAIGTPWHSASLWIPAASWCLAHVGAGHGVHK